MAAQTNFVANIAIGLVAGAIGTALMTAAQTAEMKATGREASNTPAKGAEKVFGLHPTCDDQEARLSNQVHWSYGVALGGAFGLLASILENREPATGAVFFALVWGTGLALLPGLKLSSPPSEWGAQSLATDAAFHAVYAGTTAAAYHGIRAGLQQADNA
jgi:hypothetical protein